MPGVLIMNDENANGTEANSPHSRKQSVTAKFAGTETITSPETAADLTSAGAPVREVASSTLPSLPPPAPSLLPDHPVANGNHDMPQIDGAMEVGNGATATKEGGVAGDGLDAVPRAGNVDVPDSVLDTPPEIEHITQGFQPMSKLIERVTQECFNELVEMIGKLGDENEDQPSTMVNGTGNAASPGAQKDPPRDVWKRLHIMEFANKHRERFIKLLVLLQWSRQADDVSTMIDLWNWYRVQLAKYDELAEKVGRIRLQLAETREPMPDIPTAYHILSTGKASWIPDLGYIPPKPLSSKKLLSILRNINSLLSIRLILHENIPPLMKNWIVGSGRATFTVPDEFELDLSLANEDPSTQLYFIDLRLLFSPTSDIPQNYFRDFLEAEVNKALATTQLTGCYDFLHNFVLTHKIGILRRQAQAMALGNWFDAIKVESVHRLLIVQYWLDSTSTKSWIEVGIVSGRPKNGKKSWNPMQTSRISMRWVRDGVEVGSIEAEQFIDLTTLSMENVLNRVIAAHKTHILRGIHDRLRSSESDERSLRMTMRQSVSKPADCSLSLKLGSSGEDCSVVVDTFTGRITFRPTTFVPYRLDHELNTLKDPASTAYRIIGIMLCLTRHVSVENKALNFGWKHVRNADTRVDGLKDIFRPVFKKSLFHGDGWCGKWAIALTTGLTGVKWWVAEMVGSKPIKTVRYAIPIPAPHSSANESYTANIRFFRKLEKAAIAIVSLYTNSRELRRLAVPHSLRKEPFPRLAKSLNNADGSDYLFGVPTMYIRLSSLMRHRPRKPKAAADFLRLCYKDYAIRNGKVTHVVKGILAVPQRFHSVLTRVRDSDALFDKSGGFALFLRTTFGVPIMDRLINRLEKIEQLCDIVKVLDVWGLYCYTISLGRIVIIYQDGYSAELSFQDDAPIQATFAAGNPHRRIQAYLSALLTDRGKGVTEFASAMGATIRLLRALDAIEVKVHPSLSSSPPAAGNGQDSTADPYLAANRQSASDNLVNTQKRFSNVLSPAIHTRNFDWFRVSYANPRCTFDLRLRQAQHELKWHIEETTRKDLASTSGGGGGGGGATATANGVAGSYNNGPGGNSNRGAAPAGSADAASTRMPAFTEALRNLYKQKGEDWVGMRKCIIAGTDGVEEVVLKLDETIREHAVEEGGGAETKGEANSGETGGGDGKPGRTTAGESAKERPDVVVLE